MSFSLDPEVREALDEIAAFRGVSRSAVVERILKQGVQDELKSAKLFENRAFQALSLAIGAIPGVLELMTTMAGDNHSKEEIAELRTLIGTLVGRGNKRKKARKALRSEPGGQEQTA